MKVARWVWSRGKDGDNIKVLPIAIKLTKQEYGTRNMMIKGIRNYFVIRGGHSMLSNIGGLGYITIFIIILVVVFIFKSISK